RSILHWDADQNTRELLRREIDGRGYVHCISEGPPYGLFVYGDRPVAREVIAPDDIAQIPVSELEARGLEPDGLGTAGGPWGRPGGWAVGTAGEREVRKQYCPFNLPYLPAEADSGGAFLLDAGSDSSSSSGSLDDWSLIAGQDCYKCGGIEESSR